MCVPGLHIVGSMFSYDQCRSNYNECHGMTQRGGHEEMKSHRDDERATSRDSSDVDVYFDIGAMIGTYAPPRQ